MAGGAGSQDTMRGGKAVMGAAGDMVAAASGGHPRAFSPPAPCERAGAGWDEGLAA